MSGLFGGNFLTPAQRQEAILRKALELRKQFWSHGSNFYYQGAGDLLLQVGQFYTGRELPDQYQQHMGNEGRCFENALLAAEADPALRYCEGVYSTGAGHYTPHAWCLDPDGELLELTVPTSPEFIAAFRDQETMQPFLTVERWAYWGAVFHPEYVRAVFDAQEGAGLLDRPIHDELFAMAEDMDEWRTDWPVYHYPYDADRRTP